MRDGRADDRKTGKQEDRKAGKQEDRKTGRQEDRKGTPDSVWCALSPVTPRNLFRVRAIVSASAASTGGLVASLPTRWIMSVSLFLRLLPLALAAPLAVLRAQSTAPTRALDPANLDRSFGACQDFYMFANNGWIQRNPIPPAFSSWGSFNELTERNNLVLREVVERAAREAPTTSDPVTKKLGTFYSSCMDSTAAEAAGLTPIAGELERIASIADRAALRAQIARMHSLGFGGVFGF